MINAVIHRPACITDVREVAYNAKGSGLPCFRNETNRRRSEVAMESHTDVRVIQRPDHAPQPDFVKKVATDIVYLRRRLDIISLRNRGLKKGRHCFADWEAVGKKLHKMREFRGEVK